MSAVKKEYDPWETESPNEDGYVAYLWERHFFHNFLLKYGTVGAAAETAGVSKQIVEDRIKESEVFAARMEEIKEYLKDMVRQEVFRRAVEPAEIPIYNRGILVGKRLEWDNRHLQWVAERLLPNEFHLPSRVEFQEGDGSLEFKLELGPAKPEDPALDD